MKKVFYLLIALFLFTSYFFFSSCHCKKKATAETKTVELPKRDFEKEGYTKATVIIFDIDGCKYMLQLEDQKKLEAVNLSADFQKENLAVWIKYTIKKGAMSICQAGQIIELADIQLRK